ncbi:hypothetical protein NC652_038504 [Populus alba x Populus x berolinensis]|nr:hypothetical protein NC652_038504 [Populus alba x Populus x berolinensis]
MENPSKLMVLSSSKGKNVANSHDRLIGLPEHIIHHIISFLGANDIARLSFASKGYRQICISSPYLYFDVDFASHECATKCSQFKEFLSKFLRSRNGQRIQLLRFRWLCDSCECSHERPYDSWVCDALRCDVKELDIGCRLDEQNCFALPMSATGYASLRVLKLNLQDCCLDGLLPATLVSLEVLSLKSLRVYGALLEAWISTNCPSLKRLNLEAIKIMDGFPISSTSSLQELTIHNCYVSHVMGFCKNSIKGSSLKNTLSVSDKSDDNSQFPISIAVSAEQLQTLSLKLYGSWWKGSVFEIQPQKLICVQEAIVEFVDLQFFITDKDICNSVLRAVQYARVLQLSIQIIEVLSEEDHVKILFGNLLDLVMVFEMVFQHLRMK